MLNIFVLSESLSNFERDSFDYAAAKYEYDLCKSLSKIANITVLSSKLQYSSKICDDNITMLGVAKGKSKYAAVREIVDKCDGDKVLIFWGYDLIKCLSLLSVRFLCNIRCIPFIYDTHKVAVSSYSILKKTLAEIYFGLGKFILRFFDAYILFQKKAAKRLRIDKKSFLVTKPGISQMKALPREPYNEKFQITYCGTLSSLNGVDVLLNSFPHLTDINAQFILCGVGPLLNDVIEAEKKYDFVKYGGLISERELKILYSNSDLLLNLRKTDDEAMDFAFPSKIFECIGAGVPVLTTKVLDDEEFTNNTYIINNATVDDLVCAIRFAINDRNNSFAKAEKAKRYIEDNYSFDKSAEAIVDFIDTVL